MPNKLLSGSINERDRNGERTIWVHQDSGSPKLRIGRSDVIAKHQNQADKIVIDLRGKGDIDASLLGDTWMRFDLHPNGVTDCELNWLTLLVLRSAIFVYELLRILGDSVKLVGVNPEIVLRFDTGEVPIGPAWIRQHTDQKHRWFEALVELGKELVGGSLHDASKVLLPPPHEELD